MKTRRQMNMFQNPVRRHARFPSVHWFTESIKTPGVFTEPIKTLGVFTEPIKTPGVFTEPIKIPGVFTEPIKTSGVFTEPVKIPGVFTEPIKTPETRFTFGSPVFVSRSDEIALSRRRLNFNHIHVEIMRASCNLIGSQQH